MTCVRVKFGATDRAILCLGGPTRKILAGSRMWHFEMHPYCGPLPVHKRTGNGIEGSKAFWEAVTLWVQQGERVDATGVCLYKKAGSGHP